MSSLIFTFDRTTQEFSCIRKDIGPYYCEFTAGLLTDGETIGFNNLSFGFIVLRGEETIFNKSYPPPGTTYIKSDQTILVVERINWKPDWELKIQIWVQTFGQSYGTELELTVPRPIQPYPSWTWDVENWIPPTPYPEDGKWTWDEDTLSWIEFESK